MSMTEPVEALIANAWRAGAGAGDAPEPEETWPLCRVLADAGLVDPDRRNVGIAEVGPFRVAIAPDKAALTRAFLEGGLPAVIRAFCQGMTFADAVAEILLQAFSICSTLGERTVVLRNDLAWCVLVYVRTENTKGHEPSLGDIVDAVRPESKLESEDAILQALQELEHAKPLRGTEELALVEQTGAGYRALV